MQAIASDLTNADTRTLVLRARLREADAFVALVRRYERMALSVAFSVLSDADAAGDVVQDAYLRAWDRLNELKEPAHFSTWLCGITRNLAIDLRRRRRHVRLAVDTEGFDLAEPASHRGTPGPLESVHRREQMEQVSAALQSLDEVTRSAVVLRYYDGLSSREIGATLGLSAAAVDMRLSRARQQLKTLLQPVGATME